MCPVRSVTYVSGRSLQCPVPRGPRTSFGSLSQDKDSRKLTFQFDCDLAIGRDNAHLLGQAANDFESLAAVVRTVEGGIKSFALGAIDRREIGTQERPRLSRPKFR